MSDLFRSLFTRQREFESRVHTELIQRSRERLANILDAGRNHEERAFSELVDETGLSEVKKWADLQHEEFVLNADTVLVLSYIEHYVRELWHRVTSYSYRGDLSEDHVITIIKKIEEVLITDGLLWELEIGNKYIKFRPIESESMEEIDEKVQALAEKEPWDDALEGYNAAFERYLEGDFDHTLVLKLYNSIEAVLKTICVDLEAWTEDRDRSHKHYLDILNEQGLYNANGITAPELGQLLDALEKMVSKVGNDRKQPHIYHDRAYCTLLIHQVGAYLYFLISRYDDFSK
jgi:hypothetical protein